MEPASGREADTQVHGPQKQCPKALAGGAGCRSQGLSTAAQGGFETPGGGPDGQAIEAGSHPGEGNQDETILALLRQPSGATLTALMLATQWQAHSVRGFISGQLGKRMGLRVKSFRRDGDRVYRLRP